GSSRLLSLLGATHHPAKAMLAAKYHPSLFRVPCWNRSDVMSTLCIICIICIGVHPIVQTRGH
ncbi:MAG TPA: hypothetical protein VI750_07955, partial [Pyrinomonadaceae bacterium]|nr:hypothetical protein [Pyrinomonadaceae bacterium]